MAIKELRDFIYDNCFTWFGFTKENSYHSLKRQKKNIYYHLQPN